jgi:amidase
MNNPFPADFNAIAWPGQVGDGEFTILIKDSIDVAGMPTRQGSAVLADMQPALAHAEVVENLLASARWTIAGKANMHEFAFGVTGVNAWAGTPINPLWPERIPGGSSSGSAVAVAGGLIDAALGTDTGGSVRMPAACCGVIGFKPTFGLVSRRGVYPEASSLDCVGVFARSVPMVEKVMSSIVPDWIATLPIAEASAALIDVVCSPAIRGAFMHAVSQSGLAARPTTLSLLDDAFAAGLVVMGAECWNALGAYVDHPAMGEDVRSRVKAGALHSKEDLEKAEGIRLTFAQQVDELLATHDVVILPTLPEVPPTLEEAADARKIVPLTRLVRPFNLTGHPAITLPVLTVEGLPAGLQIIGKRGDDSRLLAIARHVEAKLFGAVAPLPA